MAPEPPHRSPFGRHRWYSTGQRSTWLGRRHRSLASADWETYSAATSMSAASTLQAQNLNSGILPIGSSCGLVSRFAAASAKQNGMNTMPSATGGPSRLAHAAELFDGLQMRKVYPSFGVFYTSLNRSGAGSILSACTDTWQGPQSPHQ